MPDSPVPALSPSFTKTSPAVLMGIFVSAMPLLSVVVACVLGLALGVPGLSAFADVLKALGVAVTPVAGLVVVFLRAGKKDLPAV